MVEAVGIEPTSLEPAAQIYYKLSRCYLLAWHVTDKRPTRVCEEYVYTGPPRLSPVFCSLSSPYLLNEHPE